MVLILWANRELQRFACSKCVTVQCNVSMLSTYRLYSAVHVSSAINIPTVQCSAMSAVLSTYRLYSAVQCQQCYQHTDCTVQCNVSSTVNITTVQCSAMSAVLSTYRLYSAVQCQQCCQHTHCTMQCNVSSAVNIPIVQLSIFNQYCVAMLKNSNTIWAERKAH
jgi:hypothetical protein